MYTDAIKQVDELINKLLDNKDPFKKQCVVFQNRTMIEWFRSYWLVNRKEVLCNIDLKTIDEFVFDVLEDAHYYERNLFDIEYVQNRLITLLPALEGDAEKYKSYIYKDNKLDCSKLYDLSYELAKIFIKYYEEIVDIDKTDNVQIKLFNDIYGKMINEKLKDQSLNYDTSLYFLFVDHITKYQDFVLNRITSYVSQKKYKIDYKFDESIESLKIFSSQSLDIELETIHSDICNLIKDDKNNSKKKILVLAPNISLYKNKIDRVFSQSNDSFYNFIPCGDCKTDASDDSERYNHFPIIKYFINDVDNEAVSLCNAINTLSKIATNKKFYRKDFISIADNEYIAMVRQLSSDDILAFKKVLVDANVHRDNDWHYIKTRLLLSKVIESSSSSDSYTNINNDIYIPYQPINFDDNQIVKFVNIIDDVFEIINKFGCNVELTVDNLEEFSSCIKKWFCCNNEKYTANVVYSYLSKINHIKEIIKDTTKNNKYTFNLVYRILQSTSDNKVKKSFLNTVVFANLDYKSTIPYDYVYFIGMSSDSYPNKEINSELDYFYRIRDSIYDLESEGFKKQCYLSKCIRSISYISLDLVKGADKYQSYCLNGIVFKDSKDLGVSYIPSDDNIYTKREYKKRTGYILKHCDKIESTKPSVSPEICSTLKENIISATYLRDVLLNNFKAKTDKLIKSERVDTEELFKNFEGYSLNNLDYSEYERRLITALIEKIDLGVSENSIISDELKIYRDELKFTNKVKDLDTIENRLKTITNSAINKYEEVKKFLKDKIILHVDSDDRRIKENTIKFNSSFAYTLDNNNLSMCKIRFKNKDNFKDLIELYIDSIIFVASQTNTSPYNVVLPYLGVEIKYTFDKMEAETLFDEINKFSSNNAFNIYFNSEGYFNELFKNTEYQKEIDAAKTRKAAKTSDDIKPKTSGDKIKELKTAFNQDFIYSNYQHLFDLNTQIGVDEHNIDTVYKDIIKKYTIFFKKLL